MHKFIGTGLTVVLTALTLPTTVTAGSWICEQGTLIREINVQRETANPAPCSVMYNKETEGQGTNELWSAQFDGSYCDSKADFLAEKLTGLGWTCTDF